MLWSALVVCICEGRRINLSSKKTRGGGSCQVRSGTLYSASQLPVRCQPGGHPARWRSTGPMVRVRQAGFDPRVHLFHQLFFYSMSEFSCVSSLSTDVSRPAQYSCTMCDRSAGAENVASDVPNAIPPPSRPGAIWGHKKIIWNAQKQRCHPVDDESPNCRVSGRRDEVQGFFFAPT